MDTDIEHETRASVCEMYLFYIPSISYINYRGLLKKDMKNIVNYGVICECIYFLRLPRCENYFSYC